MTNMSTLDATMVLNQWKVKQKAYTDKLQREHRKSLGINSEFEIEHTGVLISQLRMMTEVQASPFVVGHTFYDKEILLLRIAEEANLSGCQVSLKRSDDYRVHGYGSDGSYFCVKAVFSTSAGWKVTTAETREITLPQESDSYEDVATEPDGLDVEENDDDVDGVIGV